MIYYSDPVTILQNPIQSLAEDGNGIFPTQQSAYSQLYILYAWPGYEDAHLLDMLPYQAASSQYWYLV